MINVRKTLLIKEKKKVLNDKNIISNILTYIISTIRKKILQI